MCSCLLVHQWSATFLTPCAEAKAPARVYPLPPILRSSSITPSAVPVAAAHASLSPLPKASVGAHCFSLLIHFEGGRCVCKPGYDGQYCQNPICSPACEGGQVLLMITDCTSTCCFCLWIACGSNLFVNLWSIDTHGYFICLYLLPRCMPLLTQCILPNTCQCLPHFSGPICTPVRDAMTVTFLFCQPDSSINACIGHAPVVKVYCSHMITSISCAFILFTDRTRWWGQSPIPIRCVTRCCGRHYLVFGFLGCSFHNNCREERFSEG